MANVKDIIGLREQIKENATLLFPQVVGEFLTPNRYVQDKRDAFDVFIRRIEHAEIEPSYQAILTCRMSGDLKVVSKSQRCIQLEDAYFGLLDKLGGRVGVCITEAAGNVDHETGFSSDGINYNVR